MIVEQLEIFITEVENIMNVRIDLHRRKASGFACELFVNLVQVVEVNMHIPKGVHEFTRLQSAYLRDHHREQSIGCDVEGHAQEYIC